MSNMAEVTYQGTSGQSQNAELLNYSPKTINSSVHTSISDGSGVISSTSHQHTSGSSTSQSNTYGASVSVGFMGDMLTGGASGNYSHTSESSHSNSVSSGKESGDSSNSSDSDAMSVKDWACNAYIDVNNTTPTWVWGQEYPWNVLQYVNTGNNTAPDTQPIILPAFLTPLLCDETQALPPSQLSQFGIDFTMKSAWLVEPAGSSEVTIKQTIEYYMASHSYVAGSGSGTKEIPPSVTAYISVPAKPSVDDQTIDLCLLGLDPIISPTGRGRSSAIIGFLPHRFFIAPVQATASAKPVNFKTLSSTNNLLISDTTQYGSLTANDAGAGFSASDASLSAQFTENCKTLQLTVNFKIADVINDYTLYMKHWKSGSKGVVLNIIINGYTDNALTKYVDSSEAEGGESNLLSIALRDLDFGSIDYHDYLKLGLNTIVVNITPIDGDVANGGYQVRAISVEKS